MPALVAGIHVLIHRSMTWMAGPSPRRRGFGPAGGTSPAMTSVVSVMNYWLVKSEPSSWSWDQQVAKGDKGEAWTGVRNFTARQNLVKMKKGDRAFFYHS